MQIKLGTKVDIISDRNRYGGNTGEVVEIIPIYKKDENGNFYQLKDWEVYQIDIGQAIVDCHLGEIMPLKAQQR